MEELLIIHNPSQQEIDRISEEIIENHEHKLLKNILKKYYCFTENEKNEIYKCMNTSSSDYLYRKALISENLKNYLKDRTELNLNGFVNFRLHEYKRNLGSIAEKAVEEFLLEREYREFIEVLKYFIQIQPSKEEALHVIVRGNGTHSIFNNKKRDITEKCRQEFLSEGYFGLGYDDTINYDDLLISSLITLAPQKLFFHKIANLQNKELITTIQRVFEKRLIMCDSCDFCDNDKL